MNASVYYEQDGRGPIVLVDLSRRNLLSLLEKLDGSPADSACTIQRRMDDDTFLQVRAEEDDAHYGGRRPGAMHPETEAAIREAYS